MMWDLSRGWRPTTPFAVETPFLQTLNVPFETDPPASDKEIRRREALSGINEYPAA